MTRFRRGALRNVVARKDVPIVGKQGFTVAVRNDLLLSCGERRREWNLPYTDLTLQRRCRCRKLSS